MNSVKEGTLKALIDPPPFLYRRSGPKTFSGSEVMQVWVTLINVKSFLILYLVSENM
jgi:hypothetical protein